MATAAPTRAPEPAYPRDPELRGMPRLPGGWTRLQAVALAGVLTLCVGLRLAGLLTTIGRLDADEAVTGIMAQRILHGHVYAYLAGSNYMGTLEQYLQAVVLAVLPSTPTTLRLVQVALCAATCVIVGVLGRRMTGSGWGGIAAAAIYAAGPYYSIEKGIHSHGAYEAAQVIGTVAMLLALRLRPGTARDRWIAAGLGLCVGLGVWESSLTLFLTIPAIVWALASARGSWARLVPAALAGVLVGYLPAIAYQLAHGAIAPWSQGSGASTQSVGGRLGGLVSTVLEMFLGARRPFSGARTVTWLPPALVVAVALALLAAGLIARRRGLWDMLRLRTARRAPVDLAFAGFVLFAVPYGFSSFTGYTREPRYLFILYPLLALVLAWGVWRLPRRAIAPVALVLVGILVTTSVLTMRTANARGEVTGHVDRIPIRSEQMPAVAAELHRLGVTGLYANYWLAYPIAFAADGSLAVAPTGGMNRFPDQTAAVARTADPAFAAPVGAPADALAAAIAASGARATRVDVGGIALFVHVTPARRPDDLANAGL